MVNDTNQVPPAVQPTDATSTVSPAEQVNKQLETLVENSDTVNRTSVWGYFTISMLLPPFTLIIALLLAMKRKVIFVILPSLVIAFSIVALISPVIVYFLFGPVRIVTTQFSFSKNIYSDTKLMLTSVILILLAVAGIASGIYFRRRAKSALTLSTLGYVVLILILALEHWIIWINLSSTLRVVSEQAKLLLNQQGVPF